MFSTKSYPYQSRYYTHKGQIIRRKGTSTPAPLSSEQLAQAAEYFKNSNYLSPSTSSFISGIFYYYEVTNEYTPITFTFTSVSGNSISIPSSDSSTRLYCFLSPTLPERVYFYLFHNSSRSGTLTITVPSSLRTYYASTISQSSSRLFLGNSTGPIFSIPYLSASGSNTLDQVTMTSVQRQFLTSEFSSQLPSLTE